MQTLTLTQQSDAVIEVLDCEPSELVDVHGTCGWCGDATEPGEAYCDVHCRLAAWRERER